MEMNLPKLCEIFECEQPVSLKAAKYVASSYYFFDEQQDANNCAFVTACNFKYFDGVVKLYKSMQKVKSKYPLICICLDTTTDEQRQHLVELGIEVVNMELSSIYNPYNPKWTEAFAKLDLWKWTAFDRLCWIDSDIIMLQNCDELLSIPVVEDGLACAVDGREGRPPIPTPHTSNTPFRMLFTGLFVLKPSMATYNKHQNLLGKIPSYDGGDQGFLTSVFAREHFKNVKFLSPLYDYSIRRIKIESRLDEVKCLHFVGHPKPWFGGQKGFESVQKLWDDI